MNATTEQNLAPGSSEPAPVIRESTRLPRPHEPRTYRPPATSITDTTFDVPVAVAAVAPDDPIEPQVTTEEQEPEQPSALRTVGRVAAAAGAAAFVALLFVIVIPSLRHQSAAPSSSEAIDLLKSAMSKSEQAKRAEPEPLPDLRAILASTSPSEAAAKPANPEESKALLEQFMQWQQKPAEAQEKN